MVRMAWVAPAVRSLQIIAAVVQRRQPMQRLRPVLGYSWAGIGFKPLHGAGDSFDQLARPRSNPETPGQIDRAFQRPAPT
jgi:hypothetical protein